MLTKPLNIAAAAVIAGGVFAGSQIVQVVEAPDAAAGWPAGEVHVTSSSNYGIKVKYSDGSTGWVNPGRYTPWEKDADYFCVASGTDLTVRWWGIRQSVGCHHIGPGVTVDLSVKF